MPTRTSEVVSAPSPLIDPNTTIIHTGYQVSWDDVPDTYKDATTGQKVIAAFTVMCLLASGKIVPRVDAPGAETAFGILITSAHEATALGVKTDALSGYGVWEGGLFFEQLLPEHGHASFGTWKAELGAHFKFKTYADTRTT